MLKGLQRPELDRLQGTPTRVSLLDSWHANNQRMRMLPSHHAHISKCQPVAKAKLSQRVSKLYAYVSSEFARGGRMHCCVLCRMSCRDLSLTHTTFLRLQSTTLMEPVKPASSSRGAPVVVLVLHLHTKNSSSGCSRNILHH